MNGLVFTAPHEIDFRRDLPEPVVVADRDAIVSVRLAGLCGSDLHPYTGREPMRAGTIPGHELVGTIIDAGNGMHAFSAGDLVLAPFTSSCGRCHPCRHELSARCREGALLGFRPEVGELGLDGAQAERVRIPLADSTLVRVPPMVSEETALLLGDNFTTGWFAAESALGVRYPSRTEQAKEMTIAVVGCGAVGLAAVSAALQLGVARVFAIDPIEERRRVAATLGAVAAHPDESAAVLARDPRTQETGGAMAVVEAVGSPAAQGLALTLVAAGGTLATVGVHTQSAFSFSPGDLYDQNLTYRAGRAPVRSILDRLLPEVVAGRVAVPVEAMISESAVPLAEGPDAYRRFARRAEGVRKIVFVPGS